ncbi:hypothetical protein JCGZ_09053 [Jatropha curcas]|uniref:Uncharacterized protein n=1 Tax=Jatropha curcas TaxID=180498 RepID=A0A067KTL8_JATCU|nr:hypothetical protein JCGZ_09053 [Jatropha curcas]
MTNDSGDHPTMEGQGDGRDEAIMQIILVPPPTIDLQVAADLAYAYAQFTTVLKHFLEMPPPTCELTPPDRPLNPPHREHNIPPPPPKSQSRLISKRF